MARKNDWAEEPTSLFSLAIEDVITLTTVGIDIGSATSQLSFSTIELQKVRDRYLVTSRTVLYDSPVMLTPFSDPVTIDVATLGNFIEEQYHVAQMTNDDIDSGAVILTGLALAKHNSRNIADVFSEHAGKFVAVSAGDVIEATLASRGAGIEELSRTPARTVAHIDMGGGTVKYAHVSGGELLAVAAIDIGARLIVVDDENRVLRIEAPAAMILETLGIALAVGDPLDEEVLGPFVSYAAEQVLSHAGLLPASGSDTRLLRTPPLFRSAEPPTIDVVTFSGGVSEYIYGREPRSFNDLGRPLAEAVRTRAEAAGLTILEPPMGIRATVLGASQHSVQLSGNTVFASATELLPIRNIPVVNPHLDLSDDELDAEAMWTRLKDVLEARERAIDTDAVAISIAWGGSATYPRLQALSEALVESAEDAVRERRVPLIIVCDADVANLLGRHIAELTGGSISVLVLDGIEVSEFDYLDVGEFVPGTGALPVVVKSLLFPTPAAEDQR